MSLEDKLKAAEDRFVDKREDSAADLLAPLRIITKEYVLSGDPAKILLIKDLHVLFGLADGPYKSLQLSPLNNASTAPTEPDPAPPSRRDGVLPVLQPDGTPTGIALKREQAEAMHYVEAVLTNPDGEAVLGWVPQRRIEEPPALPPATPTTYPVKKKNFTGKWVDAGDPITPEDAARRGFPQHMKADGSGIDFFEKS